MRDRSNEERDSGLCLSNEGTRELQPPDGGTRTGRETRKNGEKSARGPAIRFAVVFLVITFALLTIFRLAIGSPPMNWYLFQVALHTSGLLAFVGDSCDVESPSRYRGREAEVRSFLGTRRQDEPTKDKGDGSELAAPPLSPGEIWQYRMGKLQTDIIAHEEALRALAPPEPTQVFSREEHVATLRTRLAALQEFGPDSGQTERARMAKPGLRQFVRTCEKELDALAGSSQLGTAAFVERMTDLEGRIETWRDGQRAFVQGRLDNLQAQLRKRGPRVDFCHRQGESDASGRASQEVRFSFEVVPDCGALPSITIYLAAVFAFPTTWRRRFAGAVLGLLVLYGINVARLACLAVIGAWDSGGEWFTFSHEYVWQGVYVLCVVVTWLLWMELIVKRTAKENAP
jgi:exosortase/archaeosortase family protein